MLAARLGNVTLANAVGNGVADDKLVYTYVPDLIRYYLGEEPILPNVDTWRLEDPGALEEVLDRLDELVVKPVDGSGGKGLVVGPDALEGELDELRKRLLADPRGWIAQPVVQLSTIPTLVEDGFRPRHVDLRPFAVNDGNDIWVLPGGLTRVALPEGQLVVNSSQGGGSKDTWVLGPSLVTWTDGDRRRALVAEQATPPASIPIIARRRTCPTTRPPTTRKHDQQSQQQQQHQQTAAAADSREVRHAEPHRREPVLDRPLRRAGRRHRPHPRRASAAAPGGPVGRGGHRVPRAALGDGHDAADERS